LFLVVILSNAKNLCILLAQRTISRKPPLRPGSKLVFEVAIVLVITFLGMVRLAVIDFKAWREKRRQKRHDSNG